MHAPMNNLTHTLSAAPEITILSHQLKFHGKLRRPSAIIAFVVMWTRCDAADLCNSGKLHEDGQYICFHRGPN